ncbi:MAG: hypothetical protein ACE5L6_00890 [Candidatus Bathyarchaeia archaeon]
MSKAVQSVKSQIYNVDYNDYISLVGTAHFTRRSLQDAYEAVKQLQPSDLAIELDLRRFQILNSTCSTCPRKATCTHKCEFIVATEAIGNVDTNIWLIDMSEPKIGQRIRRLMAPDGHGFHESVFPSSPEKTMRLDCGSRASKTRFSTLTEEGWRDCAEERLMFREY